MQKRIIVKAGFHERNNRPVSCNIEEGLKSVKLTDAKEDIEIPCQLEGGRLCWVVNNLESGKEKEYLVTGKAGRPFGNIDLDEKPGIIDIRTGKGLFASYHFGNVVRPFLNPVMGPDNKSVLREIVEKEDSPEHDHRHQRGILVAHGDVNGVDDWSEEEGHGSIRHDAFREIVSGPVCAKITAENSWLSREGTKVLSETREMRFYSLAEAGIIDFIITFRAAEGRVVFGDTKEGGIISVRVATTLRGDRQGKIETSSGGIGEKESWGKRAHWCDYSGKLGSGTAGLAVFDNPANFRYPGYWHVRDYGLMTANPFALSYYYDDKNRNGSHAVEAGQDLIFRYRVFIHKGDTKEAGVAGAFNNYINPPEIIIKAD
ncbi:hypothetical protein COY52_11120 [Candidatus Desantisbacteria bacterium CG_4_10_14_0_8_um_filter_48_22]|uniref:Methane oxygenase PmoA n=1 Tax=Candidatus Desantisbacteria bacterium CG_4_10_14_0_8_um_filter_48_22 TaxID=1974543 RepID=A0A2M7S5C6_9BACT|nr:MAG: hypothetical protein COS16_09055 [Candidatus Desantisbacteria bacterium CG02_land_8_20_14_3_00_49_13]PIZ14750.1 MAG: hypothetical protein COY52_11120 [Candidatus Desantisbacteria bacterium CG_4_10_14_0_8_um_filter_48_22]